MKLTEQSQMPADILDISGMPLAMFNAIPVSLFLVDRRVRAQWMNSAARAYLGIIRECTHPALAGDVLHCMNALEHPEGCGHAPACERCVIRRAVRMAFNGQQFCREKATLRRRVAGGVADLHLLVTAAAVRHPHTDLVMLILQDVSELVRLRSLIPICASCKKIRDDERYWQSVEQYLGERLDVAFSHGICPDCRDKLYAEWES